jgi:hypothetical protein
MHLVVASVQPRDLPRSMTMGRWYCERGAPDERVELTYMMRCRTFSAAANVVDNVIVRFFGSIFAH